MKKVEVKEVCVREAFEACDGTVFKHVDDCVSYEEGVVGTVLSRLQKCEINRGSECDLLLTGSDDYEVRVFDVVNQDQVNDINILYHVTHPDTENNFIDAPTIVMITKSKYDHSITLFTKFIEFAESILNSRYKILYNQSKDEQHISDVNELEYAD